MATIDVLPRDTPEERDDAPVAIEIDEEFTVHIATIEDWAAPRQGWEFTLHEGHDFGKANNVECRLLFVAGEQASSLTFRLEQLDQVIDTGDELVLRFEERNGIARLVTCTSNGLDVELHHILTFT
jgi:hypothetical protein